VRGDKMTNDEMSTSAAKTLELTRKDFCLRDVTPSIIHENVGVDACIEESTRRLYVSLYHSVYGITREARSTIDVPATWVDHFKLRWFPSWLLKRYPVRYRGITQSVNVEMLFTDLAAFGRDRNIVYRVTSAPRGY